MVNLNNTATIINKGSGYITGFSSLFNDVIRNINDWVLSISWYEWFILFFMIVLTFIIYTLRKKLKENKRYRIRYT